MPTGTIKKIVHDRGFGFVRTEDGKDVFFHRSDLEGGSNFESLFEGQALEFQLQNTPKGPRAARIHPSDGSPSAAGSDTAPDDAPDHSDEP
ncbi:MAG: cold-shock protein [Candidatus Dormibacteria bacterium]